MPRQRPHDIRFETRLERIVGATGRPAAGGITRVGSQPRRGGGQQSAIVQPLPEADASGAAQLLVMSVTAGSITPGGDYVEFDTIVAQYGFDGVVSPIGGQWIHPVSGVYLLIYEHEWASFDGGGTIQLEIDGVPVPEGLLGAGTEGTEGRGAITYSAAAGTVGRIHIDHAGAGSELCDATVRVAITDPSSVGTPSTPSIGSGVVSLGTQDSPESPEWVGDPAGWTDTAAHWVWHSHTSGGSHPPGDAVWLLGAVESLSSRSVTIKCGVDDHAEIWLNGTYLGTAESGYPTMPLSTFAGSLVAGWNRIAVHAWNGTVGSVNPAGFILSMEDALTGEVLLRTTDAGGWTASTSQPAGWPNP